MTEEVMDMGRTMGGIAARYNEKRERILARLREGVVSASMSGIEYYPKPWDDLDLNDPGDLWVISGALAWDEANKRHDLEGLRRYSPAELDARKRRLDVFCEPCGPEREAKVRRLDAEIERLRIANG